MYISCGSFTKETIQKFKVTRDGRKIYHNERDKTFLQHNMGYGANKDIPINKI